MKTPQHDGAQNDEIKQKMRTNVYRSSTSNDKTTNIQYDKHGWRSIHFQTNAIDQQKRFMTVPP